MKLIAQDNVKRKLWQVGIEPIDSYGKIPAGLGMMKGDLIVFAGPGDPRRFPAGSVGGKVLTTDPSMPLGWVLASPGANPTMSLRNATGGQVIAGQVLAITTGRTLPSFVLGKNSSTTPLFIAAEDSGAEDPTECYGLIGSIVPVLCEGTVAVGDTIAITSTGYCGKATAASNNIIGFAVGKKEEASGYATVKCVLTGTGGINIASNPDIDRVTTFTSSPLTLQDKFEHRRTAAMSALEIILPANPSDLFYATVSVNASSSFTGFTFKRNGSTYNIKLIGHALDKKSVRYNLAIWWDGSYFWCSSKAA